jgi:hypothetical protein
MPKPRGPRPAQRVDEAPRTAGPAPAGAAAAAAAESAELARLRRERDEARALLQQLLAKDGQGGDVLARRLAALEEERMVARGQAVEAALGRSRAEAALKRLTDAIERAPGLQGWLLRRARAKLAP